jgi:diguanylate cyclase (GGDEF)-like protein
MAEPTRQQDVNSITPARSWPSATSAGAVGQGLSIFLSAVGFAWLILLLIERDAVRGGWAVEVMLALAALVSGCWTAAHRYRTWTLPMRRLQQLLAQARDGDVSIDALAEIDGGPRAIVPAIQEMLRELRTQRGAIAELESEMRTRLANRTDALQRTIGTLRQQATRDPLTGLFNRRFLDEYLSQSVQRHLKQRKDLCVLMMDVDHFKLLNDALGHAAGDDLLKAVGQLIRSTIRGEDVGFRFGGDEFVILLPGGTVESGRALADRLVSLVDALGKTIKVVPKPPRLSVGLATLLGGDGASTPQALLGMADRALYEVKRARKSHRSAPEGLNPANHGVQSPPLSRRAG